MDGIGPPPPGVDLTDDRRQTVVVGSITTLIVALLAVVLRVLSRRLKNVHLWIDDYLIIASLVPSCVYIPLVSIWGTRQGFGRHIWAGPPDALYSWARLIFIAGAGYMSSFTLTKLSVLSFYWRTIGVRESARITIYLLAAVVLLWFFGIFAATLCQCIPPRAWWDRFHPTHPMNPSEYKCTPHLIKFFFGSMIPTIITDVMMVLLPILYLVRLQLPLGQKLALVGVFLVGIFVTVVSVVRLHYLLKWDLDDDDLMWNSVDTTLWTIVETNIAIVCACLPFFCPIVHKITCNMFSSASAMSKRQSSAAVDMMQRPISRPNAALSQDSISLPELDRTSQPWKTEWRGGNSATRITSHRGPAELEDGYPFALLGDNWPGGMESRQPRGFTNAESAEIPTSGLDTPEEPSLGDVSPNEQPLLQQNLPRRFNPVGRRLSPLTAIVVTNEYHVHFEGS